MVTRKSHLNVAAANFKKTTGSRKRAAGDSSCRGKWATWQVWELLGMGSICFCDRGRQPFGIRRVGGEWTRQKHDEGKT